MILPDPREDATLFADKEIEEGPARDKHLRQERRKRLGGGEGGPPPPLEEGQNYWVERLKRNNKPIPYGQGIVDDWMQHELDEISTEQYGDDANMAAFVSITTSNWARLRRACSQRSTKWTLIPDKVDSRRCGKPLKGFSTRKKYINLASGCSDALMIYSRVY